MSAIPSVSRCGEIYVKKASIRSVRGLNMNVDTVGITLWRDLCEESLDQK